MLKFVTALSFMAIASSVMANDHTFPDITDYKKPFLLYQRLPAAQSQLLKAVQVDGQREAANIGVERIGLGLMRERYDNHFASLAVFYGQGEGEESLIDSSKAELADQYGIVYSTGSHMTEYVDWSLFLEASTGKMNVDGISKSDIGIGLGTEFVYGFGKHFDIGMLLMVSRHYNGGGLSAKINF